MANFNFRAVLSLQASAFKKGVQVAKNELKSLQKSFASFAGALGAGLGFGSLVKNLAETAGRLNSANTLLQNVTKSTTELADAQTFLRTVAKNYNQDLVTLTSQYASFRAASESAGISVQDQQKIFESFAKTAAYFGLSGAQTQSMFVAIQQMMTNTTVRAGELKVQLGNVLPNALSVFSKALGVSTLDLNDMMSKGQLLSADVLPKVADELNRMTQGADFSSLSGSLNNLKNAWYDLTTSTGFENALKGVYNIVTQLINFVTRNISAVKNGLISLASGVILGKVANAIGQVTKNINMATVAQKALNAIAKNWVGILTTALTYVITTTTQAIRKQKELNDLYADATQRVKDAGNANAELEAKAESALRVLKEYAPGTSEYQNALTTLNELLGAHGDGLQGVKGSLDDIIAKVETWKKNLSDVAKVQQLTEEIGKATTAKAKAESELKAYKPSIKDQFIKTEQQKMAMGVGSPLGFLAVQLTGYQELQKIIDENTKIINDLQPELDALIANIKSNNQSTKTTKTTNTITTTSSTTIPETEGDIVKLIKVIEDYRKKSKELENQMVNGAKSQEEYDDALADLQKNTFENIAAFNDLSVLLAMLPEDVQNLVKSFKDNLLATSQQRQAEATAQKWQGYNAPSMQERSTFFDYKKTDAEISSELATNAENYVSQIEEAIKYLEDAFNGTNADATKKIEELSQALQEAQQNASDLREAAKIAEWQDDVDKLSQSYREALGGGIKSVAGSFDRLMGAFESIAQAFNEDFALPEELVKMMSVINGVIQAFDALNTIVQTFNALQEIGTAITTAMAAAKMGEAGATTALATAEGAEATASIGAAAAKAVETGSIAANTTAKAGNAVAGAASSVSSIPYIGPILAGIAVAGIVALLISSMKKFAGGGIVGGSSTSGDHNIARVNSGEMILNKNQQATLWGMLNGKGTTGGQEVQFRIHGSDLVGAINNYQRKRKG